MKKLILSIAVVAMSFTAYSQQADQSNKDKGYHHRGGERSEARLEKMTESLSLTADQQEKVKALMTTRKEKMEAERKANHEAFDSEMKNILTEEQYQKWVAEREEMKKKYAEKSEGDKSHGKKSYDKKSCEKKCSKKDSKK